jgi:hypothetical protein
MASDGESAVVRDGPNFAALLACWDVVPSWFFSRTQLRRFMVHQNEFARFVAQPGEWQKHLPEGSD